MNIYVDPILLKTPSLFGQANPEIQMLLNAKPQMEVRRIYNSYNETNEEKYFQ